MVSHLQLSGLNVLSSWKAHLRSRWSGGSVWQRGHMVSVGFGFFVGEESLLAMVASEA